MNKIPDSYKEQNGCHNCKFVFEREDWEEFDLYCHKDGVKRPFCMSSVMKEYVGHKRGPDGSTKDTHKLWREWSEDREVQAFGICGEWEKENEN